MRNLLPLCLLLGACVADEDLVDSVGSLTLEDARLDAYVSRPDAPPPDAGPRPQSGVVRVLSDTGARTGRLIVEPGTEGVTQDARLVLTTIGALPPAVAGQCVPPVVIDNATTFREVTAWVRHPTLNLVLLRLDIPMQTSLLMPVAEAAAPVGTAVSCLAYHGTGSPVSPSWHSGTLTSAIPGGYVLGGTGFTDADQGAACSSSTRFVGPSSWATTGGVGLVALAPVRDWLRGQVLVAKGTAAAYRSLTSGKCADIPDGSTGDVNVNQYTCHGGLNQLFQRTGGTLVNVATGKCVAIVAGKLGQKTCDGGSAQQWTFPANGTIRNPASNMCWKSMNNVTGSQIWVAGCPLDIPAASMVWSSPSGDPTCAP